MYECHLTFDLALSPEARADQIAFLNSFHSTWKFSIIDGDPILGAGPRAYLTCHAKTQSVIYEKMQTAVAAMPVDLYPVRQKIEHIVYDTKMRITE